MKQGNQMLCTIDNALESIITSLMLGGDLWNWQINHRQNQVMVSIKLHS